MPKIRTLRTKKAPKGWELIQPILLELTQKLRDSQNQTTQGKRKPQIVWQIFRLHHQKSRYIFDLYYKKKQISRQLYDYCIRERWADAGLIAKWKKHGYQKLCCVQCIQTSDHTHGTTCICRVPKDQLEESKMIECKTCGCRGCSSGD